MKKLLFDILRYTWIPELLRETIQKNTVSIFTFHDPDPETFNNTAAYLSRHYNVIPVTMYMKHLDDGEELPPKSVVVTLDDGHKNNYRLLPIIKKYKIPVTIFLCSEIVDTNRQFWWKRSMNGHSLQELKSMSELERRAVYSQYGFDHLADYGVENRHALNIREVNEMAETGYVDFQSHTMYHVILDKCDDEMSFSEIKNSRTQLEEKLSKPVCAIAYPNGNYGEREMKYVKLSGYKCAFTTKPGYNKRTSNVFSLYRFGIRDNAGKNEIIVRASGLWGFFKHLNKILRPQKID